jgi:hypothetical protein
MTGSDGRRRLGAGMDANNFPALHCAAGKSHGLGSEQLSPTQHPPLEFRVWLQFREGVQMQSLGRAMSLSLFFVNTSRVFGNRRHQSFILLWHRSRKVDDRLQFRHFETYLLASATEIFSASGSRSVSTNRQASILGSPRRTRSSIDTGNSSGSAACQISPQATALSRINVSIAVLRAVSAGRSLNRKATTLVPHRCPHLYRGSVHLCDDCYDPGHAPSRGSFRAGSRAPGPASHGGILATAGGACR